MRLPETNWTPSVSNKNAQNHKLCQPFHLLPQTIIFQESNHVLILFSELCKECDPERLRLGFCYHE